LLGSTPSRPRHVHEGTYSCIFSRMGLICVDIKVPPPLPPPGFTPSGLNIFFPCVLPIVLHIK
jgi:hypothetical protein